MNENMHSRLAVASRCASVLLPLLACAGGAHAECPSIDQAAKAIQQISKQPVEVRRVVPSAIVGIPGTPSYIFADGRFKVGFLDAVALRQLIGSSAAPAKGAHPAPAAR